MPKLSMPKTYDFASAERRIYEWWQKNGWFKPEIAKRSAARFVISMPPPNVTGELHLGHAMTASVEDAMIRYHRMRGDRTLWLPGSDHAGIATQLQVEKQLLRTEEVTREELGREEFVRRVWAWKHKYGSVIAEQHRRLGASCDWDRERFTLDDGLSRAVREAFVRLYEKGLVYRGTYLVNWSPGLKTAVSDLEVEYNEEQGTLYYFKYRIAGRDHEFIPVATTRPETILGDTAVAVHPDDERYRHLIGETALVPILNRTVPVIHDTLVDPAFGTGALKITPGHDPTDYEIGQRHGLPIISVLNPDATMNENAGPYAGLDRFECRSRLWADMRAAGLTIKTEPYTMSVPRSQRGGEIVEPLISTQWYVKIKPLAEPAVEAVRSGRIRIIPERFSKVYYNWMENIRDWCISRQLWWGHRIPVWTCRDCGHEWAAREDPFSCARCGRHHIEQDPDVLDTWFSSGLWPFSTLGWPDETPDYRTYYPTSVMETGYDILFFWVARMIMLGLEMTGKAPFHSVYLHGLIRDEHGRKMSKTLGNTIDPLIIMDQYGSDALRFTLLTGSTPGNDMNFSIQRAESNRNFANKMWNAARFVLGHLEEEWPMEDRGRRPASNLQPPISNLQLPDRWILSRLNRTNADVTRLFDEYQFGEAGRVLYEFLWGEFADWYIEMAKRPLNESDAGARQRTLSVLVHVLDRSLRLLHPFMPFVTEEIWQHLKKAAGDKKWPEALIIAPWPTAGETDAAAEADAGMLMDAIRAIRNARAEQDVKPETRLAALIISENKAGVFETHRAEIAQLARLDADALHIAPALKAIPDKAVSLVQAAATIYLPLAQLVDLQAERARLDRELADTQMHIARSEGLLSGDFATKAPGPVVQKERDKLAALQEKQARLAEQIEALR
jgi:valyl-tRNA synthetase